ncbi:MAG: hypothetical protein J3Q66DRAFT_437885 [Benniella sp.]|nr:MAG: hypothetical protein J3Q66DRAFT_437885 [Benniella sp.]
MSETSIFVTNSATKASIMRLFTLGWCVDLFATVQDHKRDVLVLFEAYVHANIQSTEYEDGRDFLARVDTSQIDLLRTSFTKQDKDKSRLAVDMNRNIPLFVAAGVGVLSGLYIWEPVLKKYQRESKGTWQYEVVQQTRAEELNRHADAVAETQTAGTDNAPPSSGYSKAPVPPSTAEAATSGAVAGGKGSP